MGTIPITPDIIQVNPSVLSAGGAGLALTGMVLTENARVPVNAPASFTSAAAVGTYFGLNSDEYAFSSVYFGGFDNKTQIPGQLQFAEFPGLNVAAFLRGGNISGLSLPQLQALTGTFNMTIDGYAWVAGSVSLSAATSFSSAASIIQTALIASPPQGASVTASVAASTSSCTASINGNVMYVTAVGSGSLVPGTTLSGTGVTSSTQIDAQLSGTAGGIGTYAVNKNQTVASTTVSGTYGTMTVSAVGSGTLGVGQTLSGSGIGAGVIVTALGTGTGGTGTYIVNNNTVVGSTTVVGSGTPPTIAYDSVSGAFVVTSGIRGAASTMAFATGTLSTNVGLSSTAGGTLSQGATATTPSAFMSALTAINQNWATFTTMFDPDGGATVSTQKQAFSAWTSLQNKRYAYVGWDTDVNATTTLPATGSFGYALQQNAYDGTIPVWESTYNHWLQAFVMGAAASINFAETNGRITFAFKSQAGLSADVTTEAAATNLAGNPQVSGSYGNGYNFYGAYGNATESFIMFQRGTISGSYVWADTYLNQLWLNQQFTSALARFLKAVNSNPYNSAGNARIEQSLQSSIDTAVNAGVIVAGVTLSSSQVALVNAAAGANIAPIIQQRGWYLQILAASAAVRQSRGSPPMKFWYADGGSVQCVTLSSIVLQ